MKIENVVKPEGPIYIKRYNPTKGETLQSSRAESISAQMIWRIANALIPNQPINFDRVLGASYNTRSALETLIARTPQFFYCYPGRIENIYSSSTIKQGHKHIMWCPNDIPHSLGMLQEKETKIVISEIPNTEVIYDDLVIPDNIIHTDMDIDVKRRHSQIQIALVMIGKQLGFRTWVAQNDKSIIYKQHPIAEIKGVVNSLQSEKLIYPYEGAVQAALLIDNIWFRNGKFMPAVIEIEHSTGVTSGLTRMKGLYDVIPHFPTRYVIVAPDEYRNKVFREANRPQFKDLNIKYFPYSSVEELYALCQRRKIRGVTEEFLDCFMESTIA
ncbi:MAG: hypothetical protein K0S80_4238 [Neobacillus sp.]|nr:hypothetical protein [Neobacillus sp.]